MHFVEEVSSECLRAGPRAYILKSDADEHLLEGSAPSATTGRSSRRASRRSSISAALLRVIYVIPTSPRGSHGKIPLARLTRREQETSKCPVSNKEVASQVGISTRTVEPHRNNIMQEPQISTLNDLVGYAVRHKMVPA